MGFAIPVSKAKSRSAAARATESNPSAAHATASSLPRYLQRKASAGEQAAPVPRFLQQGLAISQPGDALEQQADRMAEQVMRTPAPAAPTPCPGCDDAAPCAACAAKQKLVQRKAKAAKGALARAPGTDAVPAPGSGRPLDPDTRAFFEPRFGYDFGQVRMHADTTAVDSARALNARAYTVGRDVVFGQDQFAPATQSGRALLAHELAHVMQQSGTSPVAPPAIQREAEPDKHDLTSPDLAGDPVLEQCFDGDARVQVFQVGDHVTRLQSALVKLGFDLPQFGIDGKYGNETAGAVKRFQEVIGLSPDGIVGRQTIGQLDRSARNDIAEPDEDLAENDFTADPVQEEKDAACNGQPADRPCPDPNTTVATASSEAIALIDQTLAQLPPTQTAAADYPAIFSQLFRNNDQRDIGATVAEVRAIYEQIRGFIARLATDRSLSRCATDCDGGCRSGSPAYHTSSTGKITFCPSFNTHAERLLIVIHESHHRVIKGSSDKAYDDTRLIDKLDHAQALLNAASFHLYTQLVDAPGSQPIGQPVKDANLVGDPAQRKTVDLALAFMEQWFRLVTFDTSQTVAGVAQANKDGHYTQNNPRAFMERVFSPRFGLTAPPAAPTAIDVQKMRGIESRANKMETVFKGPLLILETPNDSFWERGPASGLALNDRVLNLDVGHMATALLQELVHATPDISAPLEPLYVLAINDMRNLRHLPP